MTTTAAPSDNDNEAMTTSSPSSSSSSSSSSPETQRSYCYVTGEEMEDQVIFGGNSSSRCGRRRRLPANSLCWVLLNKGKTGNDEAAADRRRTELFLPARVISDENDEDDDDDNDDNDDEPSCDQKHQKQQQRRRRVQVRYARGSTYHVRRSHLLPVLEPRNVIALGRTNSTTTTTTTTTLPTSLQEDGTVLVVAETYQYRRMAVVHTCHDDAFLEIGCDSGITVHRVQRALQSSPPVPILTTIPNDNHPDGDHHNNNGNTEQHISASNDNENDNCKIQGNGYKKSCEQEQQYEEVQKHMCFGVDKSSESISLAKTRYPNCCFSVQDALESMPQLLDWWWQQQQQHQKCRRPPTVVAIDINGTRELPAVQTCLALVIQEWQPRLIIVKSRQLYAHVKHNNKSSVSPPEEYTDHHQY